MITKEQSVELKHRIQKLSGAREELSKGWTESKYKAWIDAGKEVDLYIDGMSKGDPVINLSVHGGWIKLTKEEARALYHATVFALVDMANSEKKDAWVELHGQASYEEYKARYITLQQKLLLQIARG